MKYRRGLCKLPIDGNKFESLIKTAYMDLRDDALQVKNILLEYEIDEDTGTYEITKIPELQSWTVHDFQVWIFWFR